MLRSSRSYVAHAPVVLLAVIVLISQASVGAQQPPPSPDEQQLWQRYQAQQAELEQLRAQAQTVRSPLANANFEMISLDKNESEASKAESKPDAGYEVGSDLKLSARWDVNNGIVFETPHRDFVSHLGVRMQLDFVGFGETSALAKSANFGKLEDGAFFRRIRPAWDGTAYDLMEWQVQLALEQISNNVPQLNEVWVGMKELPYVGTVRIGHIRIAQGFESAMFSSDKIGSYEEASNHAEAFYQVLGDGIWLTDSILDQHMTWAAQAYRQDFLNGATGADFNSGKWAYTGRLTAIPFYQDDGRHMLHLGVSGSYRDSEITALGGAPTAQFRARPEIRDQIGSTPLGNSSRLVDTGTIRCDANSVVGSELFYVLGPLSLQAEYAWAFMNNAIVKNVKQGNLPFEGGYVSVGYFLTGENRLYDRRLARLGPSYSSGPYTPFWLVRDGNGDCCWGCGAWELDARYSYLDLDNHAITGGQTEGYSYGVNWYLNNNFNIRVQYLHQNVFGGGPNPDGIVDGVGVRTQFFF